jgi:hypothetical protein
MELNQLFEGANNYKTLQADAARLSGKWAKSGLLEGISNEIEKNNMAMILENQAKQIVSEATQTGTNAMGTATGGAEQWAGVALPLVRKVFAQIAAKDFVSVQPMNLPSGLVFYLDFKYGTNQPGFAADSSLYGNVSTANSKIAVDTEVAGGLYGAGKFGYSINTASKAFSGQTTGSATSASIAYQDGELPTNYRTVSVSTGSAGLAGLDLEGVRAFRLYSASVDITSNPELTYQSGANVVFVVKINTAGGAYIPNTPGTFDATVKYHLQPTDRSRGDFEDTGASSGLGNITIPEINVSLASEAIVAKTRKLKAQWTPEFAQDLNAYHSIDAEAELTSLLSEYISMEIDLELLDMLITDAATTERWSAVNNKVWNPAAGAAGAWSNAGSDFYNTQGQWFGTLGTKIQKVSNKIHQKTLRGGANFLVCSPSVATILESIPGYAADTNGDKMDFAMGVQKVGNLNSRFRVYKNPYMTENVILMGYRGSQFLETGAVYSPYIPLIMTPLVYDPITFTPRKGIMTRYAKKMIRPEFYGKIFVSDIATV